MNFHSPTPSVEFVERESNHKSIGMKVFLSYHIEK
jgi:hypothetical protein